MNKRQIKLSCYLDQINIEIIEVEMVLNQLNRLKNQMNISNRIVERDLLKTKCQLELSLAALCILLRKMCENLNINKCSGSDGILELHRPLV